MAASEESLGALHKAVAEGWQRAIDSCQEKRDLIAALRGAGEFLKQNSISATPSTSSIDQLQDSFDKEKQRERLDQLLTVDVNDVCM